MYELTNVLEDSAKKPGWVIVDSVLHQLLQLSAIQTRQFLCHWGINLNLTHTYIRVSQ